MLTFSTDGQTLINGQELTTISLYEVYYSDTEEPRRYANWDDNVLFEGNVFEKATIQSSDETYDSDGKINPVSLTVGNADREIQFLIENYELIGKTVRKIQIFEGVADFISTTFKIVGAVAKKDQVTFSVSLGFDFLRAVVPSRKLHARMCWHQFKGANGDCAYAGADTSCEGSFEDCKRKGNLPRFGGFPAIPNERIYF